MDIPTVITTFIGPGGVVTVSVWLLLSDRKHSAERREELRKDIDREQTDNDKLRKALESSNTKVSQRDARIAQLEAQLRNCQCGGVDP